MNVIPNLVRWLYARLCADHVLMQYLTSPTTGEMRVYENQSTEKRASGVVPAWSAQVDYPAVRFEVMDVPHSTGNGGRRFASHPVVLIEGMSQSEDPLELEAIAGAIDALFSRRATGQQGDLAIQGSVGVEDYIETENSEDGVIKHLGGTYQFFVFQYTVTQA